MNNYFDSCTTENETRKLYVSLAKVLHPDACGGTLEAEENCKELNRQYDAKLKSLHGTYNTKEDAAEGKRKYQYDAAIEADLMNMLRAIQGLRLPENVDIQLQGTWIWVKGFIKNNFGHYPLDSRHVATLENLGCKFHSMKGECYYRDAARACHNKGKVMGFDKINKRYKGFKVNNYGSDQLAN